MAYVREAKLQIIKYNEDPLQNDHFLGYIWVQENISHEEQIKIAKENGGDFLASLSTEESRKGYDNCYRTRKI